MVSKFKKNTLYEYQLNHFKFNMKIFHFILKKLWVELTNTTINSGLLKCEKNNNKLKIIFCEAKGKEEQQTMSK